MARLSMASHVVRGLTVFAIVVAVAGPTDLVAAKKVTAPAKKPIRNPKFDPNAEQIELFDGVDAGQVTVKLIPKDAMGGTVLIENKTDKPLTVKIPDVVVGASIHAQLGNPIGNPFGGINAGINNPQGNPGQGGGQQMQGGVVGNGNNGMNPGNNLFNNGQGIGGPNQGIGQGNLPGNGLFSIPAENVISLTFNSVCLEHGKLEPDSASKYTLIPFSKVSSDPVLFQLLASMRNGSADAQVVQAAVWHQANKISFQELAEKTTGQQAGTSAGSYFTPEQLQTAKECLVAANRRATEINVTEINGTEKKANESSEQKTVISTVTTSSQASKK